MAIFRWIRVLLKNVILTALWNRQQQLNPKMWITQQNKHTLSFNMSSHRRKSVEHYKSYDLCQKWHFRCFQGYFYLQFAYFRGTVKMSKKQNQIAFAYQSGYFKRVFNVASNISRHWDILKEPNGHVDPSFWDFFEARNISKKKYNFLGKLLKWKNPSLPFKKYTFRNRKQGRKSLTLSGYTPASGYLGVN